MAKLIKTDVPAERTFTLELSESEVGTLFCAFGQTAGNSISAQARREGIKCLSGIALGTFYTFLKRDVLGVTTL